MNRQTNRRRPGGFSVPECMIALSVLGMMAGMGAYAFSQAGQSNQRHTAKRQCLAAAEAQLESIAQTGEPLPADELSRLWPGVDVSLDLRPGQGHWEGTVRYTATARSTREAGVAVTLERYVEPGQGGTP